MLINYSRCELGKRCVMKTKDNRVFKQYTLVVAMNSKGIIGWVLYEKGGMNTERMIEFLKKYVLKKRNNLIIMDNSPSHKSLKIREKRRKIINSLHFNALKTHISNVIINIPSKHYKAYMKSAYQPKNVRKYIPKVLSRRMELKNDKR